LAFVAYLFKIINIIRVIIEESRGIVKGLGLILVLVWVITYTKVMRSISPKRNHIWIILGGFVVVLVIIFLIDTYVLNQKASDGHTIVQSANTPAKDEKSAKTEIKPTITADNPEALAHDYVFPPVVNGIPPVITNIQTKQPVVFLGIDDGAYKDASVVKELKDNDIKATLFLSKAFISGNPDFFKAIIAQGSLVEDHTIGHDTTMIQHMSLAQQEAEICDMATYEQQIYGRRPILFRPPGGAYSATMLQAAGNCKMRAVVTWIAKANGGSMQYQIGSKLRPGDIVLMHFRPEFAQDLGAFVAAEKAAGLHTELLEDWIQ
jgi:peptidoglycan/xylan/chitin deacetylase (PgdA/CDA1 family)